MHLTMSRVSIVTIKGIILTDFLSNDKLNAILTVAALGSPYINRCV
jgi:hypothetical protein